MQDDAATPGWGDVWPLFGLRIAAGPLELRPVADADIPALVALVRAGLHEPERMPFLVPWTDAPPDRIGANTAAYYWRTRAETSPERWALDMVARWEGEVVGIQALFASDFAVTRSCETGSWLGRAHQGRGIGTFMRRTACTFAFDHLGAVEVTSGAWLDNPASLAVSRRVGYVPNGQRRLPRRPGEVAVMQGLVLRPDAFVRHDVPVSVEGLAPVLAQLGLADG